MEELPRFQVEGGRAVDYSVAYPRAAFDRQSILWDLNYFKYHFLKLAHIPFNESRLERDFKRFATFLLRADRRHFLYRDFQSRNVMLRDGEPWFIDYQGGRQGALQYDIASLLYDAKAALPDGLRDAAAEPLPGRPGALPSRGPRALPPALYRGYVLVRIMQAMGAYGYRGFFERKIRFLQSVPPAIDNIERLLDSCGLPVDAARAAGGLRAHLRLADAAAARGRGRSRGSRCTWAASATSRATRRTPAATAAASSSTCARIHNPGRYAEYADLCGLRRAGGPTSWRRVPEVEEYWVHVRA